MTRHDPHSYGDLQQGKIAHFPVVRTMIASDWARGHLRPVMELARPRQHQITVHIMDQLLTKAGL